MTSSYSIESATGDSVTMGIQDYALALRYASETAERTGRTVYVVGTDEDGDDIQPEAAEPSVHLSISAGSASDLVETAGAMDYDVTLTLGDVEHVGEITLIPDHDGRLGSWGAGVDHWISASLLHALREAHLTAATEREILLRLAAREDGPVTT